MKIMFVCTGNTCRSAMAEGLLRKIARDKGLLNIKVSSCGISTLPSFKVPPVVIALMKEEGVDMANHKATQITKELTDNADLILVMEENHKGYIDLKYPSAKNKTYLLKNYVGIIEDPNISDPIGQGEEIYAATKENLKKYLIKLIEILEEVK